MTPHRPVGLAELRLIADLNWCAFPPRLPIQPIFYPVLNEDYATQLARDWNPRDPVSGFCGFVLRFEIDDEFAARYPVQIVGGRVHQELWVPPGNGTNLMRIFRRQSKSWRSFMASDSRASGQISSPKRIEDH